ncbi:ComEC/Rec2 family competence protein [Sphingomonas sp. GlSt437]|uniref:ComEC/Rec2 family competence protein n=1 Tax=Sphingomonas sp. GlSt437 TaxID=3389970 RepID=UPI003A86FCCB
MGLAPLQIGRRWLGGEYRALESWLEAERDQLVLWLPVAQCAGVALWLLLPDPRDWSLALAGLGGIGLIGLALPGGGRAPRALGMAALATALGLAMLWARAEWVRGPVLAGPTIVRLEARVERIEPLPPRGLVRLRLAPVRLLADGEGKPARVSTLPPHLRVNLQMADVPAGLADGAVIRLGARLLPPPPPALPGAYDYAQVAWFDGVGATGRGFGPVELVKRGTTSSAWDWLNGVREALSAHIQASAPGPAGSIAAALATGDQGAIPLADADAMRRAGLAHLLSVSGLHLTATVGATMVLVIRLLALFPWLALRVRLPMVAAGAGAVAAIGYTLLTGAEVPTVRSCVAALLVLAALMLGREAMTLRLVAAGAVAVLLTVPEAAAGPSFQLSFAAVAAIVALHDEPHVRGWLMKREEAWWRRQGREVASLLLTGLVVEAVLAPISVYHFHRAGLYGSVANIVAIPLTTFVIMPAEALALLADAVGLGAPFWWATGKAIDLLLWIAHYVAGLPGAVAALPSMPWGAFALMMAGLLWLGLWRTRWRLLGLAPALVGAAWALLTPAPDVLVTGDGRHVAIRDAHGGIAMLRDRAGDYTQAMLAEIGGTIDDPDFLSDQPEARCSQDLCIADIKRGGRTWRVLATRSSYPVPWAAFIPACAAADIVISDRRLPRGCTPRWLKLDRPVLAQTGGISITLADGRIATVNHPGDAHPWRAPPVIPINRSGEAGPRACPGCGPDPARIAADRTRD